jgi:hypothetical protein
VQRSDSAETDATDEVEHLVAVGLRSDGWRVPDREPDESGEVPARLPTG